MYDGYGFITNRDRVKNAPVDQGDSTFFMGIQALLYCMMADLWGGASKNYFTLKLKAWELWSLCACTDYCRHPTIGDTSFDMMVIWDYVVTRWPKLSILEGQFWSRPPFRKRKSAFWDGRHRAPWMFWPAVVIAEIIYRLVDPAVYHEHFKSHLLVLKAGTAYNLTKNPVLLWFMRWFVRRIELKTKTANPFFRWIAEMPRVGGYTNWGSGVVEWMFQRDARLKDHYKKIYSNIEFHREELPSGEKLHMSDQFLRLIYHPEQML